MITSMDRSKMLPIALRNLRPQELKMVSKNSAVLNECQRNEIDDISFPVRGEASDAITFRQQQQEQEYHKQSQMEQLISTNNGSTWQDVSRFYNGAQQTSVDKNQGGAQHLKSEAIPTNNTQFGSTYWPQFNRMPPTFNHPSRVQTASQSSVVVASVVSVNGKEFARVGQTQNNNNNNSSSASIQNNQQLQQQQLYSSQYRRTSLGTENDELEMNNRQNHAVNTKVIRRVLVGLGGETLVASKQQQQQQQQVSHQPTEVIRKIHLSNDIVGRRNNVMNAENVNPLDKNKDQQQQNRSMNSKQPFHESIKGSGLLIEGNTNTSASSSYSQLKLMRNPLSSVNDQAAPFISQSKPLSPQKHRTKKISSCQDIYSRPAPISLQASPLVLYKNAINWNTVNNTPVQSQQIHNQQQQLLQDTQVLPCLPFQLPNWKKSKTKSQHSATGSGSTSFLSTLEAANMTFYPKSSLQQQPQKLQSNRQHVSVERVLTEPTAATASESLMTKPLLLKKYEKQYLKTQVTEHEVAATEADDDVMSDNMQLGSASAITLKPQMKVLNLFRKNQVNKQQEMSTHQSAAFPFRRLSQQQTNIGFNHNEAVLPNHMKSMISSTVSSVISSACKPSPDQKISLVSHNNQQAPMTESVRESVAAAPSGFNELTQSEINNKESQQLQLRRRYLFSNSSFHNTPAESSLSATEIIVHSKRTASMQYSGVNCGAHSSMPNTTQQGSQKIKNKMTTSLVTTPVTQQKQYKTKLNAEQQSTSLQSSQLPINELDQSALEETGRFGEIIISENIAKSSWEAVVIPAPEATTTSATPGFRRQAKITDTTNGVAKNANKQHPTKLHGQKQQIPQNQFGTLLSNYAFQMRHHSQGDYSQEFCDSQQQQSRHRMLVVSQQSQVDAPIVQTLDASSGYPVKKVSSAAYSSRKCDFYDKDVFSSMFREPLASRENQSRAQSSSNRFPRDIFTPNVQKAKRLNSQSNASKYTGSLLAAQDEFA